ncbi:MAG: GNAT family N-acetyltransferase [Candidatus Thermoplasmatota archaeon]|nr:GNAT family N-acetyltransferase [Candidatus Thermoplasmatota archaeon]
MGSNSPVGLVPISEEDFRSYLKTQILEYAKEKVKSGNWEEREAFDLSTKSFMNLLPGGRGTFGHSIMSIVDSISKDKVGVLWVEWNNKEHNASFIWDIIIHDNFRRKGYGSAALKQLEKMAAEKGSSGISLHVFGHNKAAISMYESLGYYATNIIMKKDLGNLIKQ